MSTEDGEITRHVRRIKLKRKALSRLANSLFLPDGKNPYFLNKGIARITINNLPELRENLDMFTEEDALWLASWLEYIGDKETATKIRETPGEFKEIIEERHDELREFYR